MSKNSWCIFPQCACCDVVNSQASVLRTAAWALTDIFFPLDQKMMLESRLQELERTLDREREDWQHRLRQKEQELLSMRSQMFSQLEDYETLLDVKLALDMEINAYRKMLEVEEQRSPSSQHHSCRSSEHRTWVVCVSLRLQLSPSPSQRTSVPRTHDQSSLKLRGKKRKHEGASGSSPASKMSLHSSERSPVCVSEVDVDGRFVRLKNVSEKVRRVHHTITDQLLLSVPKESFRAFVPTHNLTLLVTGLCGLRSCTDVTTWHKNLHLPSPHPLLCHATHWSSRLQTCECARSW